MRGLHDTFKDLGRVAQATLARGGQIAKRGWENRDLVAKGIGIALPVVAGGLAAGPAGALAAGVAQSGELSDLKQQVKRRKQGLSSRGPVEKKDKDAIRKGAESVRDAIGGVTKPRIESSRLQQIKSLMQGQAL